MLESGSQFDGACPYENGWDEADNERFDENILEHTT